MFRLTDTHNRRSQSDANETSLVSLGTTVFRSISDNSFKTPKQASEKNELAISEDLDDDEVKTLAIPEDLKDCESRLESPNTLVNTLHYNARSLNNKFKLVFSQLNGKNNLYTSVDPILYLILV